MEFITKYVERPFAWGENRPAVSPGVMHVIREGDQVCAVEFCCPCGCGTPCYTPIASVHYEKNNHVWDWGGENNWFSPSIRRNAACKSHFFIKKDGTVQWCPDSPRKPE